VKRHPNLLHTATAVALTAYVVSAPASRMAAHPPERIDAGCVLLRRVIPEDAEAVADAVAASMEHLKPWMPWAAPEATDPANQRARILEAYGSWEAGTDFIYSVLLPIDDRIPPDGAPTLVGTFGLHARTGPGSIEMGYWIHAAHAGRGYGTAAARALTSVALELPDVRRVEIHCDVANAASAAIPRRLGYRLDRIQAREPETAAETGRQMIWVRER
jgi:RimJ/RimL family protein N-acetyltransferase